MMTASLNFVTAFSSMITEVMGYCSVKDILLIRVAVLSQYRSVWDGQTD